MKLNVSSLPREALYGPEGSQVDLASIVTGLRPIIDHMATDHIVKEHASFGFALAHYHFTHWDDPQQFTWLVVGWGSDGDRYIANALCKLRATLREHCDTLSIRQQYPSLRHFRDVIETQKRDEDGLFAWGDFPWGGATLVHSGDFILPCAVSCLKEVEDDAVAKMIGGFIGAAMLKLDYPHKFA
jgi:hypothetical protein